VLRQLLEAAEVVGRHKLVDWQSDGLSGHVDNWKWWAYQVKMPDAERAQIDFLGLMDAIYDGLGTEDRIRLFQSGRPKFRDLRVWMGIE
jgi:hypothetical protein